MTPKQTAYENQAMTIIKALNKRNISGYYFHNSKEALAFVDDFIKDGSMVRNGGSMTLADTGIIDMLMNKDIDYIPRSSVSEPDDVKKLYREGFNSDYYLMSTNAITIDGKLVNIDGNGNRVAALIYGPDKVIVVAGMNKVVTNEDEAVNRIQNIASPANAVRLGRGTPCGKSGKCHQCYVDDCMCCEIVTTRKSAVKDRIHVVLIGDELGY